MSREFLDVKCLISTPRGWLNVNDHVNYELEGSTIGSRSVTFTRHESKSSFMPGSWIVDAHKNNVEETLSVWVNGDSPIGLNRQINRLTDALTQLKFSVDWAVGDSQFQWQCQVADYQVITQRELLHADRAQVTSRIRRTPEVTWFKEEDLW